MSDSVLGIIQSIGANNIQVKRQKEYNNNNNNNNNNKNNSRSNNNTISFNLLQMAKVLNPEVLCIIMCYCHKLPMFILGVEREILRKFQIIRNEG